MELVTSSFFVAPGYPDSRSSGLNSHTIALLKIEAAILRKKTNIFL